MLTRDAVLAVGPRPNATLDVPAWGGTINLRSLTLAELLAWGAFTEDRAAQTLHLVRCAAVDAEGRQLFTAEDDAWLSGHPLVVMDIARVVMRHNGVDGAGQDDAAGN
jgi:hypothetical protein